MVRHSPRRTVLIAAAVLVGLVASAEVAHAGWLTITNDTKQVIVIQETTGPLNRPVRGKCIRLQPGETHREYSLLGGTRNVVLYDADALNNPLATEKMVWDDSDTAFQVRAAGKRVSLGLAERKK